MILVLVVGRGGVSVLKWFCPNGLQRGWRRQQGSQTGNESEDPGGMLRNDRKLESAGGGGTKPAGLGQTGPQRHLAVSWTCSHENIQLAANSRLFVLLRAGEAPPFFSLLAENR